MTSIGHIKDAIAQLPDAELREVSLAIVRRVESDLPRPDEPMWPVSVIAGWVARDVNDPALARSLQLLVGWRDAQLLDVHYIYYDPNGLHPHGRMLPDDEVRAAYASGQLEDPDTGDLIDDFESTLEPYFVPASDLVLDTHAAK